MSVSDLNDRPELLLEIQKMMYSELNTTIRLGQKQRCICFGKCNDKYTIRKPISLGVVSIYG